MTEIGRLRFSRPTMEFICLVAVIGIVFSVNVLASEQVVRLGQTGENGQEPDVDHPCVDNAEIQIQAQPSSVRWGESSQLTWSVGLPEGCGGVKIQLAGKDVGRTGSLTVKPATTREFQLVVSETRLGVNARSYGSVLIDVSYPEGVVIGGSAFSLEVPPVFEFTLSVGVGTSMTCETRNAMPATTDAVIHIMELTNSNGIVHEIARDDDSGGNLNARVTFRGPSAGRVRLLLRAAGPGATGVADLYCNNRPVWLRLPVAGAFKFIQNLRKDESLTSLPLAKGPPAHTMYVFDTGGRLERRMVSGPNQTVTVSLPPSPTKVVMLGIGYPDDPRPMRLVRNDNALSGHDPDRDGLGTELEAHIGTCSVLSGFAQEWECSRSVDARDTDGDGLSDGAEFLGILSGEPYQHLPRWGADPRHKDLFFEVDFMLRTPGETAQKMSPSVARALASFYQDEVGSVSPLLKAYHAAVLQNPNGLPGITVHLDTGMPPQNPEDATLYGDWGGHSAVPPVKKADGTWAGADPHTAWKSHMSTARHGVFRYMLPYSSGGGSNPINTYACTGGILDGWLLAHECGHAMGLGHSGPPGVTGVVDPNCKPNYPSPMNYAFAGGNVGFADNTGAPSLNNWSLKEWNGLTNSSPAFINVLEDRFQYWVDRANKHVDWNRDGVIAPAGTTVRAYANFTPAGGGCEYTRYNQSQVSGAQSDKAPAVGRLRNRLYMFYADGGAVNYTVSTSTWNCPVPDVTPCGTWGSERPAGMNGAGGVDVAKIKTGSVEQLLVVTIDQDGKLWERRLSVNDPPILEPLEFWTAAIAIPGSSPASGEPSLETFNRFVYLVYKGTDGKIRFNRLSTSSGWTGEQLALTTAGTEIESSSIASPAIVRAYLPWKSGQSQLYGAFPDSTGWLDIWWLDSGTGRWEKTDVFESRPGPVSGRSSMAWVPYQDGADFPGRLYLVYPSHNPSDPQDRPLRMMMSYVKTSSIGGTLQKTEKIGLNAFFDNIWAYAYGIDLLYEPGVDSNLRAALSHLNLTVWMRPKADGIQDFTYTNYNDWEVLRVGLCENLVKEAPLPRIRCPTKTW